jgi:hypothetical protein
MTDEEAANDIAWDSFRDWAEPERVIVNVNAAYREFERSGKAADPMRLFGLMAKAHFKRKGCPACNGNGGLHIHDPTH